MLGGEPLARPTEAARLYKAGMAPKIFVSGVGDAARNRQILMGAGVPPTKIITEPDATTTYANATLLKPLMEAVHVRSALIVTSPFHTRRALSDLSQGDAGYSIRCYSRLHQLVGKAGGQGGCKPLCGN